jgi:hypothetical protein
MRIVGVGMGTTGGAGGENPLLADYLLVIEMVLGGEFGGIKGGTPPDPQTQFLLSALATVVTNPAFLSALQSGQTPLDQSLETLLNSTAYGSSMLQDFQAIAAGGAGATTAINHLAGLLGMNGSPVQQFLSQIQGAGLSYTISGQSPRYYQDLCGIAGLLGPQLQTLFMGLNNVYELPTAQNAGAAIYHMLSDLYYDAVYGPNAGDPLSQFIAAILNTVPVVYNPALNPPGYQSLLAFMQDPSTGIANGTGTQQSLEELYMALSGQNSFNAPVGPEGTGFNLAQLIENLTYTASKLIPGN